MAKVEIILPAMGEGIIEATITRWLVNTGDEVAEEDPLVEIATDKVDTEIPSPLAGRLIKKLYNEGDIPRVGEVIGMLHTRDEEADSGVSLPEEDARHIGKGSSPAEEDAGNKQNAAKLPSRIYSENEDFVNVSPFVRSLARAREISTDELKKIRGLGDKRSITKEDLNDYILKGRPFGKRQISGHTIREEITVSDKEEIVEMDRMRKLIAANMVRSLKISAHVNSVIEIDVTNMVAWRNRMKNLIKEKFGVRLTYTPIIVEAVSKALRKYPRLNVSVANEKIIYKKYINIGVATALNDGNLIVPKVKDADRQTLIGLAKEIEDLSARARSSDLKPAEITGGTFTVTNMGQFNNITGIPLINQPEVAILAVGAIKRKPYVVNTPAGESIGIRDILMLSLSYDHRVIDGALGGSFLDEVGGYLENFDVDREL